MPHPQHAEPSWRTDETPQTPMAAAAIQPVELSLAIALGSRLHKKWGEVHAKSFEHKGTIHLNDRIITIRTSVSRLFRSPLQNVLSLQREDVYNTRSEGRFVQFDLVNGPGELETIIVRTRHRDDAKMLVAALPTHLTRTYATENRERLLFLGRINERTPHIWATWTIVGMSTLIYFGMAVHGAGRILPSAMIAAGSNFGPATQAGQWWRLLTSVFLHAGFLHLLFNMLALVQSGRVAERLFGTTRFVALYVFAGLTGSLVSILWHPGINSVGASGAIFGVLGAIVAYLVRHGSAVPRALYMRHLKFALAFIAIALPNGFRHYGIDNGAHLGGLFGGFVLGLLLAPPPHESAQTRDRRVMSLGLSAALACGLVGGMMWALQDMATRPDRQEAMRFSALIAQSSDLERHAVEDVNALKRYPPTTQGRAAAVGQIRDTLVPEWRRLYDSMNAAKVSPNSRESRARDSLLTYYGGTLKLLETTQNIMASTGFDDKTSATLVQMLVRQVDRERGAMQKRGAVS